MQFKATTQLPSIVDLPEFTSVFPTRDPLDWAKQGRIAGAWEVNGVEFAL